MLIKPDPPAEGKPKKKQRRAPHIDAIIAAGATATGSLLLYMFTQIGDMRSVVSRLDSVQNVLIDEDGVIRPSQAAIRSKIQLEEMKDRIERLERAVVNFRSR
jgi:hypothetical protein